MAIEENLYSYLTNDAAIAALVGTRVYPLTAEQGASLPLLVYQRVSTPREVSQSGSSGLAHPRFQISCLAASYGDAVALANAVVAALNGYKGTFGAGSIQASFVDTELDVYDFDTNRYRRIVDVIIWHAE